MATAPTKTANCITEVGENYDCCGKLLKGQRTLRILNTVCVCVWCYQMFAYIRIRIAGASQKQAKPPLCSNIVESNHEVMAMTGYLLYCPAP